MALDRFRAPSFPSPPVEWNAQFGRQLISLLELYFSQLDSRTPNNAQRYTADMFVGGDFSGDVDAGSVTADTVTIDTLSVEEAYILNLRNPVIRTSSAIINNAMLDNVYASALYGDGRFVYTPFGQFYSNQDQTATAVDQAYAVTFENTGLAKFVTVASNSRITFQYAGVYSICFDLQVENPTASTQQFEMWLRKNGTDISNTAKYTFIPRDTGGGSAYFHTEYGVFIEFAANDYVEVMWRVANLNVQLSALPAVAYSAGVTPAIPAATSAFANILYISPPSPLKTPVAPLSVFGSGGVGEVTVYTP